MKDIPRWRVHDFYIESWDDPRECLLDAIRNKVRKDNILLNSLNKKDIRVSRVMNPFDQILS